MAHNKEKYQLIETDTKMETTIELADKDIKIAILSMLHVYHSSGHEMIP